MYFRHFILSIAFLFISLDIFACKTPVYKYALKKWGRDVYIIARIYDSKKSNGQLSPAMKAAVIKMVKTTNVVVMPVDKNSDVRARFGDEVYKYYLNQLEYQKTPFYMIFNTKKKPIYTGKFKPEDIPNLMISPARERLIKALISQKVVFMFISSSNNEKNIAAKKILEAGIKAGIKEELIVRKKRVKDLNAEEKKFKPLEVMYVEIDPNDAKEEWFKRQLLGISDKIKDDDEPKVLGVVGQGYVFEKCLTKKSLNEQEVIDHIIFLTGPCSCTVKRDNKGMDLITGWDWAKSLENLPKSDLDKETSTAGFGGEEVDSEPKNKVAQEKGPIVKKKEKKIEGEVAPKLEISNGPLREQSFKSNTVPESTKTINKETTPTEKQTEARLEKKSDDSIEKEKNETHFMKIILGLLVGTGFAILILNKFLKSEDN